MFRKSLLSLVAFIALSSLIASATNAYDGYTLGPFLAVGYGETKNDAKKDAFDALQEAITEIEEGLPEGDESIGVVTTFEWDGIAYEITFTIAVFDGEP